MRLIKIFGRCDYTIETAPLAVYFQDGVCKSFKSNLAKVGLIEHFSAMLFCDVV